MVAADAQRPSLEHVGMARRSLYTRPRRARAIVLVRQQDPHLDYVVKFIKIRFSGKGMIPDKKRILNLSSL